MTELLALTCAFPWIRWTVGGKRMIPSFADLAFQVLETEIIRAATQSKSDGDANATKRAVPVIDLCSGTGGPSRELIRRVKPHTADDGMISSARVYKADEFLTIANAVDVDHQYQWMAGHKSFLG